MKSITIIVDTSGNPIDFDKLNKIKDSIISSFKENDIDINEENFHINIKCYDKNKVTIGDIRKGVIRYLKANNIDYTSRIQISSSKSSLGRSIRDSDGNIVEYIAKYTSSIGIKYIFRIDGKTGQITRIIESGPDGMKSYPV